MLKKVAAILRKDNQNQQKQIKSKQEKQKLKQKQPLKTKKQTKIKLLTKIEIDLEKQELISPGCRKTMHRVCMRVVYLVFIILSVIYSHK